MLTNLEPPGRYQRQSIPYDELRSRHPEPSWATAQHHRSIVLFILLLMISLVVLLLTGFHLGIRTSLQFFGSHVGSGKISTENVWVGMKAGEHCLRYATRQYTAQISEVLGSDSAMKACKDTPVEIHGKVLFTDFCQDLVRPWLYCLYLYLLSPRDFGEVFGDFGWLTSMNQNVRRSGENLMI
jgi:hypothetical protein